jgi:hypothetical protein
VLHKVNLDTGAVTDLTYGLAFGETGSYDIAIGPSGKGIFDGSFGGSGWVPVRQIDLSTDALTTRTDDPGSGGSGQVRQNTGIARGADRSLFFFTESNISSGPVFAYNATTDTFANTESDTNLFPGAPTAVNRNGTLIAMSVNGGTSVMDPSLRPVHNLTGIDGGVFFDPNRDVLYGVNSTTDQAIAYDTNTWSEKYRINIGENVGPSSAFGSGVMAVSADGKYLFLATANSWVHEFDLPADTGVASQLTVGGFSAYVQAGLAGTVTVTARDAAGNVATGYTGTVHFTSSDGQAVLPNDYAFTAADQGVLTVSAALKTAGTQSLTVTDTSGLGGSVTGITVNPAAASSFVVTGFPSSLTAGTPATFTVTAKDAYGNTATGYSGTIHFRSTDSQALLPADAVLSQGVGQFSATLKTAGPQSITATDTMNPALTDTEGGITVNPAAASGYVITAPANVSAGVPFNLTVTVVDAFGNVVVGYTGTIHFSSTDTRAKLPANYTFTAADQGVHTFTGLVLRRRGNQKIAITDTRNPSLTGSVTENVS